MTPSQTEVGVAVSGPPESASEQPLEELRAIDTAVLEKLIEIRGEQTRLAQYCAKGAELKGTVKEAVWQRVLSDYAARSATLEELAAPLKGELQREYQKLRALHARITASYDQALLAKEELEFREAVGELTDMDLKAKLDVPQTILDRCQRDLAAVETQKAKFVAAIGSEADLEEQPVPRHVSLSKSQTIAEPAKIPQRVTTPESVVEPPPASETEAHPVSVDAAPITTPFSPDMTRVVQPRAEAPKRARASNDSVDPQQTFILKRAAVFVTLGDAQTTEHRLGAISVIGRTEENQIQIAGSGVSRRHALIAATPTGFTLKDLGSQNGTFVNGDPVGETQRPLAEGDRIVIGDAQILFRFLS
jgi:hypothetical protein